MTLAENEVCFGWLHEICYLVGVIKLWWGGKENLVGDISGGKISKYLATGEESPIPHPPWVGKSLKDYPSLIFLISFAIRSKKLGKVITPDPWKKGARNTTGKKTLWMKIICGSAEFCRFTFFRRSMKFCVTATLHLRDHPNFVGRYS